MSASTLSYSKGYSVEKKWNILLIIIYRATLWIPINNKGVILPITMDVCATEDMTETSRITQVILLLVQPPFLIIFTDTLYWYYYFFCRKKYLSLQSCLFFTCKTRPFYMVSLKSKEKKIYIQMPGGKLIIFLQKVSTNSTDLSLNCIWSHIHKTLQKLILFMLYSLTHCRLSLVAREKTTISPTLQVINFMIC